MPRDHYRRGTEPEGYKIWAKRAAKLLSYFSEPLSRAQLFALMKDKAQWSEQMTLNTLAWGDFRHLWEKRDGIWHPDSRGKAILASFCDAEDALKAEYKAQKRIQRHRNRLVELARAAKSKR